MKKLQKRLQLLTLILVAGLLFLSVTIPAEAYIPKQGTVTTGTTLRQNADASSAQVMELTSGQQVTVNDELTATDGTKWYQVFVNDTTIGYLPESNVTITGNAEGGQVAMQTITITERVATVTANSAVRVRAEATTSSNQVASMNPNDTCKVLEDVNSSDGYVWYKIEFDDNGTTISGHVRSDLVTVKEVQTQQQVPVETPSGTPTTPEVQPEADPYSITSQVNAEGTTVWYLVDNETGTSKEITTLLAPQEEKPAGNTGVYKIIVVILLILVIAAAAAATFFYMRWQDAEAFIFELHEKQVRAKKQSTAARTAPAKQNPVQPAAKPANKPVPTTTKPTTNTTSKLPAAKPEVTESKKEIPVTPAPKAVEQPAAKEEPKVEVKPAVKEVLPDTADIVNATKKELQDKQPAPENKQSGWKSKNFLTDDDDLEFDFLDMDDK